ncbi:MAG: type II toxin-antitoxin system RelE/ParE family toxin [Spirochaetales bacterium]|nr:type II toxin-antitoxin system RelE/ParE family toxin [Spirochaetales bacterium]
MLQSFQDKETEKVWNQEYSKKLPRDIQRVGLRKLFMLNRAIDLDDLKIPPSNCLEKLKGNRKGQFSIRINQQWRICFNWKDGEAYKVEIVDYHQEDCNER